MIRKLILASAYIVIFSSVVTINVSATAGAPHSACPTVEEEFVDLRTLESALRETKAIGVFTKLRLKKSINKLLGRLDKLHSGKGAYSISQLEEQYNLLLMKIATLVHDSDLVLHQQLCNAWTKIWLDLKDPDRFRQMQSRKGT